MKVRLSVGQQPYSGYLNIDPFPSLEQGKQYDVVPGDIKNLDNFVEPAQATEILAIDVLDYINHSEMVAVLNHYTSKLRHRGKIVIGGTDAMETAKQYLTGKLDTVDFNNTMFGSSQNAWSQKSGVITLTELWQLLQDLGLKVTKKNIDGNKMFVEAFRE